MDKVLEFLKAQGIEWQGTAQVGESLAAMAQGMLGIFVVIALIVGATTLLNAVTSSKKDDKDDE